MRKLTTEEVALATGGTFDILEDITSVVIDNREVEKGSLFVAIKGERLDGHKFVESAVLAGASAVMVDKDHADIVVSVPKIVVEDTRKAFLDLAKAYRLGFGRGISEFPVVALTGSVGKTTTKEMIWCVLNSTYNTHKTYMNWNNDIGLPKVLLGLSSEHEALVLEMGMDHKGEISTLTNVGLPDIAVITNVGVSHIENLGSRDAIKAAKLEIVEGLPENGSLIINADNDKLSTVSEDDFEKAIKIIRYGIKGDLCANLDIYASDIEFKEDGTVFKIHVTEKFPQNKGTYEVKLPTTGEHNVYNAMAAFSVGSVLEIPAEKIVDALLCYRPAGMREKIKTVSDVTVIEDCYNASPDSVKALCETLKIKGENRKRKIAVFGDMLELGDFSDEAHALCGKYMSDAGVDLLMTYGEKSKITAETARENGVLRVFDFDNKDELSDKLISIIKPGDVIAFKASRGMKLEDVIEKVYKELEKGDK